MLREDIDVFLKSIEANVNIVAATKYVDSKEMLKLLDYGVNSFGENRVDSFLKKYDELKDYDIKWHFIGHLQRNKALKVINKIDCLHSLDSLSLAKIINEQRSTPLDTFIEVSVNEEENKNGVRINELSSFVEEVVKYKNINLIGFMMMAKDESTKEELIAQFSTLKKILSEINNKYSLNMTSLSMGMSNDYKEAILCGATHIRLGRILWKN
jgi:pyridoxal phosphate enzyme (YggS family)